MGSCLLVYLYKRSPSIFSSWDFFTQAFRTGKLWGWMLQLYLRFFCHFGFLPYIPKIPSQSFLNSHRQVYFCQLKLWIKKWTRCSREMWVQVSGCVNFASSFSASFTRNQCSPVEKKISNFMVSPRQLKNCQVRL